MIDSRLISMIVGCIVGAGALLYTLLPSIPSEYNVASAFCAQGNPGPAVTAKAAYAYDLATGTTLYDKNSDAQLPLASLTKVMTVLTALQALTPEATVTITEDALSVEGEYGLRAGERWEVQDLIDFTLISSSNDGARALMLAAAAALKMQPQDFYNSMNRRAEALGLSGMFFLNETGLDVSTSTAGAYGSARDVAHLFGYVALSEPNLVEHSVRTEETFVSLSGITHTVENTSLVASSLSASYLSKTGYTDLAGGNLAVVFEPIPGHPVAIAALGGTRESRNDDVRTIAVHAAAEAKRAILCNGDL